MSDRESRVPVPEQRGGGTGQKQRSEWVPDRFRAARRSLSGSRTRHHAVRPRRALIPLRAMKALEESAFPLPGAPRAESATRGSARRSAKPTPTWHTFARQRGERRVARWPSRGVRAGSSCCPSHARAEPPSEERFDLQKVLFQYERIGAGLAYVGFAPVPSRMCDDERRSSPAKIACLSSQPTNDVGAVEVTQTDVDHVRALVMRCRDPVLAGLRPGSVYGPPRSAGRKIPRLRRDRL